MRRLPLLLVLLALAGCGGGSSSSGPDPSTARATTAAERSAQFTVLVDAVVGGSKVETSETGTIDFSGRRAHVYKLVAGSRIPQEVVVDGPFTFTNANVEAAIEDPTVKPWTKLDTRRLSAKERESHPDELAHVLALLHLPDGMDRTTRVGDETVAGERVTQFRGVVRPARVVAEAPPALRRGLAQALRNDYPARPFLASVWLDDADRVRRVHVSYDTAGGTKVSLDGRFSEFGAKVDTRLPPARSIADITP